MHSINLRSRAIWLRSVLVLVLVLVLAVITFTAGVLAAPEKAEAAPQCGKVTLKPSQDLVKVAQDRKKCTTFNLKGGGTFHLHGKSVPLQSADIFKGLGKKRVKIDADGAYQNFDANGAKKRAFLINLDIYGTSSNDQCESKCGKGVGGQKGTVTLIDVRLHGHPNNGASLGSGSVIRNSLVDHNGSFIHSRLDQNDPNDTSSSAGIKFVGRGLRVENVRFEGNYWNPMWCDNGGSHVTFVRNTIIGGTIHGKKAGKTGFQFEACRNGVIAHNTFINNGHLEETGTTKRGCLLVQQSAFVNVHHNVTKGCRDGTGIWIRTGGRQPQKGVNIHHNRTLGKTKIEGCDKRGVRCYNNS